ncbi:MAG: cell division protein FtsW [Flavobacteriaceae bacterium]|nr:cell division protein FtsW [Flavobacteriaceae bacterium]|tara:strand:- start:21002 stop:22192 length:1191 start_codon:yes stop_codon:yes gene_type:complete
MFNILKGDKVLWVIIILLSIFSFLPIYSASSNLVYVIGKGTPWSHLIKHFMILSIGFILIYSMHKVPYNYFKGISILLIPITILLLIYTFSIGTTIDGTIASRWIQIPIIGLSFQTSSLAFLVLMIYAAYYLSKTYEKNKSFKSTLIPFWLPILLIISLIMPSNFSTAGLIFISVITLSFIGGYPVRYLISIFLFVFLLISFFIISVKIFPDKIPNRVDTWISRIENFSNKNDSKGNYQIERAKIAIVTGEIFGLGAGKSRMKNFLPQSSSDFIYAIIVEEFGLIGGVFIIIFYLLILFRITVISFKAKTIFSKLLVIGLGLPIIIQAFINIGVALQVFPVTGQTLPLISSGGTSAWMTCIAIGIILSVSIDNNKEEEENKNIKDNNPIKILSETV